MELNNPLQPTREFYEHPHTYESGITLGALGAIAVYRLSAAADEMYYSFHIPHDFTALVECIMLVVPVATATHRINLESAYAANGQDRAVHNETDLDIDIVGVQNTNQEVDLSGVLANIFAGDYVGIKVIGDAVNLPDLRVRGLRFRYR